MAQVTGHKIIREPVQITVDNSAIWNIVKNTCLKEFDGVKVDIDTESAWGFTADSPTHPVEIRPATDQELLIANALDIVEEIFYKHCKD